MKVRKLRKFVELSTNVEENSTYSHGLKHKYALRVLRRPRLIFFIAITLLVNFLDSESSRAAVLSFTKVNFTQSTDIWGLTFSQDGNMLYFAENGSAGMHRILTSNLNGAGTAISSSSDGFASFRTSNPNWQNTTVIASPTTGVSGHNWIFSGSGNINKPASPTDSLGASQSGVVWAIDTFDHSVTYMNTKRSDGNWQNGQMYWLAVTPNGKYLYAVAWKAGSPPSGGIEVFKYDLATNTQKGLGVNSILIPWNTPVADNQGVYFLTSTGILKIAIDGNNLTSTGDAAPSMMTLSGTATNFNFANANTFSLINGQLYVTATDNTMAIINPSTGAGTFFTLTNSYNSGNFYGAKMGVDGCLYAYSSADKSINQINPNSKTVIASTGAITNNNPYWDISMSMNPSGTIFAISPTTASNNGFYVLSISGNTCISSNGSSFNSFSLPGGARSANFRTPIVISANVTVPSKITFFANNAKIPGCIRLQTTGSSSSNSVSCSWKPSRRGGVNLSAISYPSDTSIAGANSGLLSIGISNRSASR